MVGKSTLGLQERGRLSRFNAGRLSSLTSTKAAWQMLLRIDSQADGYYPYHAACADLLRRADQREAAAEAYKRALALCSNSAKRAYLRRRLDELIEEGS